MKKILIGTTALIAASMITAGANAKIIDGSTAGSMSSDNPTQDNIIFKISGNVNASVGFGHSSEVADHKDNLTKYGYEEPDYSNQKPKYSGSATAITDKDALLVLNYEKDRISQLDIWSSAYMDMDANYKASDANAIVQSANGHLNLIDGGTLISPEALDLNVEVDTKFGNVIIGDKNFTSAMGVVGNVDDSDDSAYIKDYSNADIQDFDLADKDLADGTTSRIQYNTGNLIKLATDEKGNVTQSLKIGVSLATNRSADLLDGLGAESSMAGDADLAKVQDRDSTTGMPIVDAEGEPVYANQGSQVVDYNGDSIFQDGKSGYSYYQKASAKQMVYAGGLSYNGDFGTAQAFGVFTFQHTDGINLMNVSGSVTLLDKTLNISGGMTMVMFGETDIHKTWLANLNANLSGDYKQSYDAAKPIFSLYAGGDYTIPETPIKVSAGVHFGYQGFDYKSNSTHLSNIKAPTGDYADTEDGSKMEFGLGTEVDLKIADNVTWTIVAANFDYSHVSYKKLMKDHSQPDARTAFGAKTKIAVSF